MAGGFLTTSNHLVIGPTNTMSLLVYVTVAAAGGDASARIEAAVALTILVGSIQVLCALAGFGELLRYVSHSVIVGFSAGAGVLIAAVLGIPLVPGSGDTTARGTAMLAACAAGRFESWRSAVNGWPHKRDEVQADRGMITRYEIAYERFKMLYPHLRQVAG